ncbi:hypothetical protein G9A89_004354 [Geosiphon pyriformis]|nr:hypothetical protein G9A89_004354 [Geosiphon pyriformis]
MRRSLTDLSNFEFTGFGESSPYTVFAALDFVNIYKLEKKPIVVTFGQPRMGNEVFTLFAQTKLEIFRVTFVDDWLPNVPLRGIRKFSKWSDIKEIPENNRIPAYLQYTHFTPEYWIERERQRESGNERNDLNPEEQLNCECPLDAYPILYKCFNTHSLREHPECNARKHDFSYSTELVNAGKPDDFRYGPYFGKNMNNCPGATCGETIKPIAFSKIYGENYRALDIAFKILFF